MAYAAEDLSQAEVSLANDCCNAVLAGLAGENEITDDRSVRQVEFTRVCGSALRELHLGFRTRGEPRNFTPRDADLKRLTRARQKLDYRST